MKEDEDAELTRNPLQKYASEVFGETLVTGVPNIVHTHNWSRKIFKLFVLLFCISGFLYQSIQFLSHVFSYPSMVDISVRTPSHYLFPAITICNNNGIMRSKFCQKYPERCEKPRNKTLFCDEYPSYSYYCRNESHWKSFMVPKREFYGYEKTASLKELKELSHESEPLFTLSGLSYDLDDLGVKGPLIFFKNEKRSFSCYTIHFRADSTKEVEMLEKSPWNDLDSIMELEVDFEPSETFLPGRKPGGFVDIHSPFDFYSPFEFGHRLRPGQFYKIHIKLEEETLLPSPYKSDCTNYTERWLDNGRTGPRGQAMCKRSCLFNISTKFCNCTFKYVVYPYHNDTCFADSDDCLLLEAFLMLEECMESCKDECEKNKFSYVIQEREVEEIDGYQLKRRGIPFKKKKTSVYVCCFWESEDDKEEQITYLSLYLSDPEVVVLRYKPRYQSIEIFSYIGGYIGAWLGISLVAVVDFVECMVLVVTFAFKKKQANRRRNSSWSRK